jgi:hypothetical protein
MAVLYLPGQKDPSGKHATESVQGEGTDQFMRQPALSLHMHAIEHSYGQLGLDIS